MREISLEELVIYSVYNRLPVPCLGGAAKHVTPNMGREFVSMSRVKSNFFKVPTKVAFLNKIPAASLRVLLYLLTWQNSKKGCYTKQETISQKLDISLSTIKRAIKWLEKEGYVTVYSGKGERTSNIYEVNFKVIDENCVNTFEENRLRKIEFNREMANKVHKPEKELREKLGKPIKNMIEN